MTECLWHKFWLFFESRTNDAQRGLRRNNVADSLRRVGCPRRGVCCTRNLLTTRRFPPLVLQSARRAGVTTVSLLCSRRLPEFLSIDQSGGKQAFITQPDEIPPCLRASVVNNPDWHSSLSPAAQEKPASAVDIRIRNEALLFVSNVNDASVDLFESRRLNHLPGRLVLLGGVDFGDVDQFLLQPPHHAE